MQLKAAGSQAASQHTRLLRGQRVRGSGRSGLKACVLCGQQFAAVCLSRGKAMGEKAGAVLALRGRKSGRWLKLPLPR